MDSLNISILKALLVERGIPESWEVPAKDKRRFFGLVLHATYYPEYAPYFREVASEMLRKGHISPELFMYLMNRSEDVLARRNPQRAPAGPLFDTLGQLLEIGVLPPGFNMDSLRQYAGYCIEEIRK